jgi:hypothetical protein
MAITFPASPVNGQTHTENGQIFVFDSTRGYWLLKKQDQIVASTSRSTFVATAGQTVHTVNYDPSASVIVSVNGVMLNPQDITSTNGTSIIFDTALALSDEVDIVFHQPTASNLIRQDISDPMATESYVQTYVTNNSSAGATTAYANFAAFSNGTTEGDFAFAQDTKALYVWDGTEWDRVDSGDESPIILTEPPTTHSLNSDGTTSTMTMVAEDPEGFDVTYGIAYKTSGNTRPSQLSVDATVDANGVYTFTPSSTISDAGTFRARLSASDGAKTTTRFVDVGLTFQADIEYMMVAGGGGGGEEFGGGGGAGGVITSTAALSLNGTTYNIVIGQGGTGGASDTQGGNGGNTTFLGKTALGGGGGGYYVAGTSGSDGGSGGGGGSSEVSTTHAGGAATQPSSTDGGLGYAGGGGRGRNGYIGGGGGGAGGVGGNAIDNTASGDGGLGIEWPVGSGNKYAGGGSGGAYSHSNSTVVGSVDTATGAGLGSGLSAGTGASATANTGSGGGGGGYPGGVGGVGGSGIVIIHSNKQFTSSTGTEVYDSNTSKWVYTFTAGGNFVVG